MWRHQNVSPIHNPQNYQRGCKFFVYGGRDLFGDFIQPPIFLRFTSWNWKNLGKNSILVFSSYFNLLRRHLALIRRIIPGFLRQELFSFHHVRLLTKVLMNLPSNGNLINRQLPCNHIPSYMKPSSYQFDFYFKDE